MAIVPAEGWSMPDGVIPDAITPRVGWRAWVWTGKELVSPLYRQNVWSPGQAVAAVCTQRVAMLSYDGRLGRAFVKPRWSHRAPDKHCMCGIYAVTERARAEEVMAAHVGAEFPVIGRVALWGVVQEHGGGYRAEFAYPQVFYVPRSELKEARKKLAAFGVPILDMESAHLAVPSLWAMQRASRWANRLGRLLFGVSIAICLIEFVVFAFRLFLQGGLK